MAIDPRLVSALHLQAVRHAELSLEEHAAHVVFQTSTLEALLDGAYDGDLTIGELRRHGDLGLGTFDGLDGEMIVLDGEVWRARVDGMVERAGDEERTPFAVVTPFAADQTIVVDGQVELDELMARATSHADRAGGGEDARARGDSRVCARPEPTGPARSSAGPAAGALAVRFDGRLDHVHARSVPRQPKPYPPLVEAATTQQEFAIDGVEGSLVGFVFPTWAGGVELPGAHLHAITADRTRGGHVLHARVGPGVLLVDPLTDLHLELPAGVELPRGDGDDASLRRIEGG
ncbi:MAG TPA: acetolactate decarboxylase [Conexibacter sp.]|nr:acetolactate decarboxylase [Conexibacter sp.]